jgi:hypothetical protein
MFLYSWLPVLPIRDFRPNLSFQNSRFPKSFIRQIFSRDGHCLFLESTLVGRDAWHTVNIRCLPVRFVAVSQTHSTGAGMESKLSTRS